MSPTLPYTKHIIAIVSSLLLSSIITIIGSSLDLFWETAIGAGILLYGINLGVSWNAIRKIESRSLFALKIKFIPLFLSLFGLTLTIIAIIETV